MKKRIIGMITAALLAASLPVCASGLTAVGLETENVGRQWEKHAFFERMEALTGVAVEGRGITETKEWQKTLAAMEKGERPADILFKANLSRSEEKKLLELYRAADKDTRDAAMKVLKGEKVDGGLLSSLLGGGNGGLLDGAMDLLGLGKK